MDFFQNLNAKNQKFPYFSQKFPKFKGILAGKGMDAYPQSPLATPMSIPDLHNELAGSTPTTVQSYLPILNFAPIWLIFHPEYFLGRGTGIRHWFC